jgi:uncharacterized membrane protein
VGDHEVESEPESAERLIFFSDAVVAIAITLLALELPVPTGHTVHDFWSSARGNSGHYLAFLISFVVIANAWGHHHDVFRYVERSDARLRTYNMLWLLMIVLTPFATKLLTSKGHDDLDTNAFRYGFYALLQVFAYASFLGILQHVKSRNLQASDTPLRVAISVRGRCYGVILGFGLSIPIFFATTYGWVLWIVGPVLVGQVTRWQQRRLGRRA